MRGEVKELEELYRAVPLEHRNALLRGVGEQLAIGNVEPRIPPAAFRLEPPEGATALQEGFERTLARISDETR